MCCGRSNPQGQSGNRGRVARRPEKVAGQVEFQYVGRTALTVKGTSTGMRYRFAYPGHRLHIDASDQAGMEQVPVLKLLA
jgi:hypothetical protein